MSYIYGAPILDVSRSHTTTHHSRKDSSGRVISSSQRPLPDNTQHSQQTNIHAPGGIRTHDLSRRAAADLRLRPRGYWHRLCVLLQVKTECLSALYLRGPHQFDIILKYTFSNNIFSFMHYHLSA